MSRIRGKIRWIGGDKMVESLQKSESYESVGGDAPSDYERAMEDVPEFNRENAQAEREAVLAKTDLTDRQKTGFDQQLPYDGSLSDTHETDRQKTNFDRRTDIMGWSASTEGYDAAAEATAMKYGGVESAQSREFREAEEAAAAANLDSEANSDSKADLGSAEESPVDPDSKADPGSAEEPPRYTQEQIEKIYEDILKNMGEG